MSEELLQNLMQLFAIIAKVDGASLQERVVVSTFLSNTLNLEDTSHYLALFDQYVNEHSRASRPLKAGSRISVRDSSRIMLICSRVNQEMTQQQKVTVVFLLFSLIRADGSISPEEYDLLRATADVFNISREEFSLIEQFSQTGQGTALDHPDVAIISANPYNPYEHARHVYLEHALGFFVVLRIPSLNYYLIKYQGNGFYYLNGAQMVPGEAYPLVVGSTLRSTRHATLHYTDIIGAFLVNQHTQPVSYQATDISLRFLNGNIGLHPFSFSETGGKLIGIMGPSGAGKSTLIEVLTGNAYPTTGQIFMNGLHFHDNKSVLKSQIGYVPQDDLLIEELSVYDNVYYALRLSYGDKTPAELEELVNDTLISLGIIDIAHLKVGSVLDKTISGGERKRVNIALELSRAPSVLFFDEPTSGLSSRDSQSIMDLLKELALTGKMVFVVIHQPSSVIFKMFDRLLLLDKGGYAIYYGNPLDSIVYFKTLINQINRDQTVCPECGNVNPEQIFDIIETRTVNQYGRFTNKRKISPQTWYGYFQQSFPQEQPQLPPLELPPVHPKPSAVRQWLTYLTRDVKAKLHNVQYLTINLLQAPLLATILALVNRYSGGEGGYVLVDNDNMPVYLFMCVIVALFIGMVVSAEEIYHDRKILRREAFLKLSRHAYLMSKTTLLFSLSAIQMLLFVAIGNGILGYQGHQPEVWATLFTTACFANLVGLNISSSFKSVVTIYIFIPILLIPQLLLGGVVVDFNKINPALRSADRVPAIAEVMVSRWAYEGLMVHQFMENAYEAPQYDFNKAMSQADFVRLKLIPALEAKSEHLLAASRSWQTYPEMKDDRRLLALHLERMADHSARAGKLAVALRNENVSTEQLAEVPVVLEELRELYAKDFAAANDAKSAWEHTLLTDAASKVAYRDLYRQNFNEAIAGYVKNQNEKERLLETREGYVQIVDAIYHDPEPRGWWDFRTHFFAPVKHFLGAYFDTLWFNIAVIWVMTGALYWTLYHNVFYRLLRRISAGKLFPKVKIRRRQDEE